MGVKRFGLAFGFIALGSQLLVAQQGKVVDPVGQAARPQPQVNKLQKLSEIQQWLMSMRDECTSAISIAQLADVAWALDENYARGLYRLSLVKVSVGQNDDSKLIEVKNAARRRVMSLIARRDMTWSKSLVDASTKDKDKKAWTQLEIAGDLLETDPAKAAELAAQSIQSEVNQGQIAFVKGLRGRDSVRADQMFGQLLVSFLAQPNLTTNDFALLGTYVFRSRFADAEDERIIMQRIGDVMLPDLTGDRPGVSPASISNYLRGAITLLQRPAIDPTHRNERYALGHMLIPKTRQHAANLEGELLSVMTVLSTQVPTQYTNGDAYKYLNKLPGSLADRIDEIEKVSGSATRDQLYLDVVFQAYRKKDFDIARLAASKIDDSKLEGELELLIAFGETNAFLAGKSANLARGFELVEKMPESLEKSLLQISVAAMAAKAGNKKLEEELLELARVSAASLNSHTAPFLVLYISGKYKDRKDPRAAEVFNEATKLFNKHETIRDPNFIHPVSLGSTTLRFSIKVENIDLDFTKIFRNAVRGSEEEAIALVSDIKDERLRGLAYISLAKFIIGNSPTASSLPGSDNRP